MKKILSLLSIFAFINNMYCQGTFYVSNVANIKSANSAYIVLDNMNVVNNGNITQAAGDGTVKFTGSNNVSVSGSGTTTIDHLLLAKGSATNLNLNTNIGIATEVFFTSGLLNLNNSILTLTGSSLFNNESEVSRAFTAGTGYAERSAILNAPASANPGNLGAIITSSQNMGTTLIRRGHKSQTNTSGLGNSILRYFDITPTNNAGLNATFRFQYFDAELNGLDENTLIFGKSLDGITWANIGFDSRNTIANYVEKTGINDFSRWTLSSPGNALPITFTFMNAKCISGKVILTWQTAQEFNSRKFDVEQSSDGISWIVIGSVNAAGNSNTIRNYSFTDLSPHATTLYRISEIAINGNKTNGTILRSSCVQTEGIQEWPNPAHANAIVQIISTQSSQLNLKLYDSKGRLLMAKQESLLQGTNFVNLKINNFPAGTYTLMARWGNNAKAIKIIKE